MIDYDYQSDNFQLLQWTKILIIDKLFLKTQINDYFILYVVLGFWGFGVLFLL